MEREKLIEYLKTATEMEQALMLQNAYIKEMGEERRRIHHAVTHLPVLEKPRLPFKPQKPRQVQPEETMQDGKKLIAWLGAISAVVFIIVLCIEPRLALAFVSPVLLFLIALPFALAKRKENQQIKAQEINEKANREYESAVQAYERAVQQQKDYEEEVKQRQVFAVEAAQRIAVIDHELNQMEHQRTKTEQNLTKLYDCDVIFPKYRSAAPVFAFLEYLSAGICQALEGEQGAYSRWELEVRMDRVIAQLNDISWQLQKIRENQYTLYQAVREIQKQNEQLIEATMDVAAQVEKVDAQLKRNTQTTEENAKLTREQLKKLEENSAVTAYAAKQSQKELHYMNRMNYWTGKNDGVWDNLPPQ